ncbi:oxygenase MpaB family protein [Tsukamurella paurometabola]|uniref:Uncharacterized protein conserved in bacteria n=2 Tax=Tsukamurella paurometabola TaxID=2061 RepID=A0A3P8K0Y2_TSUPA|nr:oxygenase MpaB family protein [Tsukamurella paurometabola]UEA81703.1 oxygenase MpaB family protein [Tsukamurella paurometabola]VDR38714.1 Uncharacterized protein conserved in bacteria [Tsukamurella paurometabola]
MNAHRSSAPSVTSAGVLSPDTLLWQYGCDSRMQLLRGYTGILQNMLPAIGTALVDHSAFFRDPFGRLARSTPQVIGSIYADDDRLAHRIRDYHHHISGIDQHGRRYHALNPDVFWWAHATFVERIIRTQDLFGTPFTNQQKDQIVQEGAIWWASYGLSDRPVIRDYPSFRNYWNTMLDNELGHNRTTTFATRTVRQTRIPAPGPVPELLWRIVQSPAIDAMLWITTGALDPRCREILDLSWTERDARRFERFQEVVRNVHPLLPVRLRYMEPGRTPLLASRGEGHQNVPRGGADPR